MPIVRKLSNPSRFRRATGTELTPVETETTRVGTRIETYFPELAPVRVQPLGQGWDNHAYLVNDETVFRFPKHARAAKRLRIEAEVLPHIAANLPTRIPQPRWWAQNEPTFLGYPLLHGKTACVFRLDEDARSRLAHGLGVFLAALHGLDVGCPPLAEVPPDDRRRLEPGARLPLALEHLEEARRCGLLPEVEPWRRLLAESIALGFGPTARTCLVHGDLYVRHLLLDEAGGLTGIIDWGDLHLGDPALDLELIHHFLPRSAHAAFSEGYGPIEPAQWHRGRFRALYHALVLLIYATEHRDQDLAREMLTGLRFMVQGP